MQKRNFVSKIHEEYIFGFQNPRKHQRYFFPSSSLCSLSLSLLYSFSLPELLPSRALSTTDRTRPDKHSLQQGTPDPLRPSAAPITAWIGAERCCNSIPCCAKKLFRATHWSSPVQARTRRPSCAPGHVQACTRRTRRASGAREVQPRRVASRPTQASDGQHPW